VILPASDDAPEVLQPGEEPFDLPAAAVASQGAGILREAAAIATVGRNQFDPSLGGQAAIQGIAILGRLPDQARGVGYGDDGIERRLDERDFMRRSTADGYAERKTSAVCNGHDLGPFAPLGFPDEGAPFLAPAKVPSMKHSERSSWPRASRSRARAVSTFSMVPLSTQYWNRR